MSSLRTGLINVNGLRGKIDEVTRIGEELQLDFIVVTETWLRPTDIIHTDWRVLDTRNEDRTSQRRGYDGVAVLFRPRSQWQHPAVHRGSGVDGHAMWISMGGITFGCLYLPPRMDHGQAIAMMTPPSDAREKWVMMGDLNARMGRRTGDTAVNDRGRRLAPWLMEHGGTIRNDEGDGGKWTYISNSGRSVIDLVITNTAADSALMEIKVHEDLDIGGSDHRLVTCQWATARMPRRGQQQESDHPGWCLHPVDHMKPNQDGEAVWRALKQMRKKMAQKIQEHLAPVALDTERRISARIEDLTERQQLADQLDERIRRACHETAEETLPRRSGRQRHWKWFWTSELDAAVQERRRMYRAWHTCSCPHGQAHLWERYKELDKKVKKMIARAKKNKFREFAERISTADHGELTKTYRYMVRKRRGQSALVASSEEQTAADECAAWFERIYDGATQSPWEQEALPPDSPLHAEAESASAADFPGATAMKAMKKCGRGRAPGPDRFTVELLLATTGIYETRAAREAARSRGSTATRFAVLLDSDSEETEAESTQDQDGPLAQAGLCEALDWLFSQWWRMGVTPTSWNQSYVVPLYKGKGARTAVANHRPVVLSSVFRKIFEKAILGHLQHQAGALDIRQGGFREKRGTLEQAVNLHEVIQLLKKDGHSPVLAFLDIKSAYDRVDHATLWSKCKARGINGRLLSILQSLFSRISMSVVVRGERSYTIRPRCGLLQGSILSPLLFSIFIDDLPSAFAEAAPGCIVGDSINVNSLLFADDVALIAKTPEDMQRQLDAATSHAEAHL
jgi:hypothetical protein